jgi:hypothetical protein
MQKKCAFATLNSTQVASGGGFGGQTTADSPMGNDRKKSQGNGTSNRRSFDSLCSLKMTPLRGYRCIGFIVRQRTEFMRKV